jgi:hypothetical protein
MKYLFILGFLSLPVLAEMPDYLKDGTITVTLKDGSSYKFSTNEYMVVKRGVKKEKVENKVDSSVVVTLPEESLVETSKELLVDRPYRLTVHWGLGYNGLEAETNKKVTIVSEKPSFVLGATFSKKLDKQYSLSGSIFTNRLFTLGVGKDF